MRFKIVRLNILVGIQLVEPHLMLPKRLPEVFEAFYKALSPRHRMQLTDMQSEGGNTYGDLKLSINVFNGKGRIEITPGGLTTDLRDLVQSEEDRLAMRDYLVTCEQTLTASAKTDDQSPVQILQRDIRANFWIDCEEGKEAAETWLLQRGDSAARLANDAFADMKREYTFQISLIDEQGARRLGVGIQKSHVVLGHLYLACEHQMHRKGQALRPMDDHFDLAYAEVEQLLRQLGLEPASDDI